MNQASFKRFLVDSGDVVKAEVTDEFAGTLASDLRRSFERECPGLAAGPAPRQLETPAGPGVRPSRKGLAWRNDP